MSKMPSFKDYHSQLNTDFQIEQEPGKWVTAKLVEANELQYKFSDGQAGERISFSLVFQTGVDVHLPQRILTIKHGELGEHKIFLIPIPPSDDRPQYEAIFT